MEMTDKEKIRIIEDTFNSISIDETLKKIGPNGITRREFNKYIKNNPDFKEELDQAEKDACRFIENDMLNIHKGPKKDHAMARAMPMCHKLARVKLEAMKKILEYRNPGKYSPKVDVNMNSVVSIRDSINNANDRIKTLMRDAMPIVEIKPIIRLPK